MHKHRTHTHTHAHTPAHTWHTYTHTERDTASGERESFGERERASEKEIDILLYIMAIRVTWITKTQANKVYKLWSCNTPALFDSNIIIQFSYRDVSDISAMTFIELGVYLCENPAQINWCACLLTNSISYLPAGESCGRHSTEDKKTTPKILTKGGRNGCWTEAVMRPEAAEHCASYCWKKVRNLQDGPVKSGTLAFQNGTLGH